MLCLRSMKLFKRFAGDKKVGKSLLHDYERAFINWAVPKIPKPIQGWHLTLITIPICLGLLVFGYLSQQNNHWLWGSSALIALQWLTDSLDGSLGKYRQAGTIKWGFYMDHLLDYFFLCSIVVGYMFGLPPHFMMTQVAILVIFGGFMVSSYLAFAATNEFRIAYLGIGPTEVRLVFIFANTMLIVFGKTYLGAFLPFVLGFAAFGLCFVIQRTQAEMTVIDKIANKP